MDWGLNGRGPTREERARLSPRVTVPTWTLNAQSRDTDAVWYSTHIFFFLSRAYHYSALRAQESSYTTVLFAFIIAFRDYTACLSSYKRARDGPTVVLQISLSIRSSKALVDNGMGGS